MYTISCNPEILDRIAAMPEGHARNAATHAWHVLEILDQMGESDVADDHELDDLLADCNTLRTALYAMTEPEAHP